MVEEPRLVVLAAWSIAAAAVGAVTPDVVALPSTACDMTSSGFVSFFACSAFDNSAPYSTVTLAVRFSNFPPTAISSVAVSAVFICGTL